uniref:Uncharacterized protein n=1 Tax=Aegilops tauschii TaxID=37682 RepID=N1QU26_AEGTA
MRFAVYLPAVLCPFAGCPWRRRCRLILVVLIVGRQKATIGNRLTPWKYILSSSDVDVKSPSTRCSCRSKHCDMSYELQ